MRTSRPIVGTVLVMGMMLLGPGPSAVAASETPDADGTSRLQDTLHQTHITIPWEHPPALEGGTCMIPATVGSITPVDNTGERVRNITRDVRADGSQVIVQDDLKTGAAKDSHDETYYFIYANHAVFNVSPLDADSNDAKSLVQVKMIDSFRLTGNGLNMHVGFNWSWEYIVCKQSESDCAVTGLEGITLTLDPLADFPVIPFVPSAADHVMNWQQLSTQGDPYEIERRSGTRSGPCGGAFRRSLGREQHGARRRVGPGPDRPRVHRSD